MGQKTEITSINADFRLSSNNGHPAAISLVINVQVSANERGRQLRRPQSNMPSRPSIAIMVAVKRAISFSLPLLSANMLA
jgi:hypothetical protein